MKTAHLIQQLFTDIGGLQVCLHNVCQQHSQKGVDVHVFCCDAQSKSIATGYKVKKFFNFRAITQLYPMSKYLIASYVAYLQKKHQFDIWQIYGGYPYGAFLAGFFQKNKIPCVLRCSGDDIQIDEELNYGVRRNTKINRIIMANYKKFSAGVAITHTIKQEYLKVGMPEDNISLIPNGVDIKRLKERNTSDIREIHDIPPESTVIISVGRNHPKKGYNLIPKILRIVLNRGLDVYWIVIGRGCTELKPYSGLGEHGGRLLLMEQIGGMSNSYELPSDDLIRYYKGANLFAMTSMLESFGIVLIEAMAAGLPIVCFDAPGIRDVMTPECGTICANKDIEAFAQAIIQISEKKDLTELSVQCSKYAEQFSWDIVAGKYLSVYESLLS